MRCPYCAEEVKDDAVVCKHCHRELFIIKPLIEKHNALSARLASLNAAEPANADVPTQTRHATAPHASFGFSGLESVLMTYVTLVVAHFLIIVHFDLRLIYLKFVSIAAPFIFGLLRRVPEKRALSSALFWGFVCVVAAISTMLAIVSEVDKVPFLPQNAEQWQEFTRYSASVAFGYLTGAIVRLMYIAFYYPNAKPNKAIEWIARFIIEQFGDGKQKFTLKAIRSMVSSILGFVSAVVSILAGMWEYLLKAH